MSSKPLGRVIHPVRGLTATRVRKPTDFRIPSAQSISDAHAAWQRRQAIGSAGYYVQAPTSSRNANPRHE
jgi:hypothetical protein